jgi:3-hydroxybutyrate dehydrogenase
MALGSTNRYKYVPISRIAQQETPPVQQAPTQSWSNFWTDTETSSYATIDINLSALMRGTRLAIRDQVTRSPETPSATTTTGVIINVSSLAAQFALLNQPLYGASKVGVSCLTRSLSPLDRLFGIKVVAVAPGMVNTPLWTDHPREDESGILEGG